MLFYPFKSRVSDFVSQLFNSKPDPETVFEALSKLFALSLDLENKRSKLIQFSEKDRFIIFSDQHKGAKNGSDDFVGAELNYLAALNFYLTDNFHFINLGDCEELWENGIDKVWKYNQSSFEIEKAFLVRNAFTKVFGNHDLYWDNSPFAKFKLKEIYGSDFPVYEGVVLQTFINESAVQLFLAHGHQGDAQSDGNWFSKFVVANIWGPIQNVFKINPNTPSTNNNAKTAHNKIMYEWAVQNQKILITGHTHQPVFESLTHLERLYLKLEIAQNLHLVDEIESIQSQIKTRKQKGDSISISDNLQPNYFNTGCCCFSDGDITGIEIADGKMRLVRWGMLKELPNQREVMEECSLESFILN